MNKLIKNIIKEAFKNALNEMEIWYHGTSDSRELEKEGGFTERTITVDYIEDTEGRNILQQKMNAAKKNGDESEYLRMLDLAGKFIKKFKFKKPIFFTDKYDVAKTYSDPARAFDYQNAEEKVYKVEINPGRNVKIIAIGDRFRFINTNKVKQGFVNSGISEEAFDKALSMFTFYVNNKNGIKTDVIAAIGSWFEFDSIDVVGVLDSYHGGTTKSIVRMVFDPSNIKIINTKNLV